MSAMEIVFKRQNETDQKIEKIIDLIRKIATDATEKVKLDASEAIGVLKNQTNQLFVGERLGEMDKGMRASFESLKESFNSLLEQRLGGVEQFTKKQQDAFETFKKEFGTLLEAKLKSVKIKGRKINLQDAKEELEEFFEEFLKEIRKDLKYLKNRPIYVAGGAISASHSPIHESFTVTSATTSVTLAQAVGAQGTALIVRYQGQVLDLTTHYTVDGNTITFVGITFGNNKTLSVTFWP